MHQTKTKLTKVISLCLLFVLLLIPESWARKSASIAICAETGEVYHEQNADEITHPASLTKMMTLYLTFKAIKEKKLTPLQNLRVSAHAAKQAPSKLGLKPGTTLTVRQAILGLITKSANDAAVVLAEALGGSEVRFAQLMTTQAHKLGMTETIFKNASGLPNMQQVTTARDMATLSRCLYKHFPDFFHLFKTEEFVYKGVVHGNHNKLLGKVEGVDGIKTGFTNASGFNLAASMVRGNNRIIAVVLGGETAKSRNQKMIKLLETTHAKLARKKTFKEGDYFDSIDDIIHTLGQTTSTYLTGEGKIKILHGKYNSVDDILNVLDEAQPTLYQPKAPAKAKLKKAKIKAKKPPYKSKKKTKKRSRKV